MRDVTLRTFLFVRELASGRRWGKEEPGKGARPLKRVLEERVLVPIAARMAEDASFRDREVAVVGAGETAPGKVLVVIDGA